MSVLLFVDGASGAVRMGPPPQAINPPGLRAEGLGIGLGVWGLGFLACGGAF